MLSSFHTAGTGSGQPARRGLHQRQTSPEPHPTQNRGDGPSRHPAVRHLSPAAGVPRLRVQNPLQVPGNGLHQARGHWRQQAKGEGGIKQILAGMFISAVSFF